LEINVSSKFNGSPGSKIDRLTSQYVNHEVGCVQKRKFLSAMEELKEKKWGKNGWRKCENWSRVKHWRMCGRRRKKKGIC